jgi:DtxR family Mn-dependent transcriptional regulator
VCHFTQQIDDLVVALKNDKPVFGLDGRTKDADKTKREAQEASDCYFIVQAKMGFGWDAVHEIAEQVEHIQSPEFFEKMDELLGFPKFDPHGSPIPDKEGKMEWKSYEKLLDLAVGEKVRIAAVVNASDEFLKFLNSRNIYLGLELTVLSVEAFDRSMIVSYSDKPAETFSQTVSERLLVERL